MRKASEIGDEIRKAERTKETAYAIIIRNAAKLKKLDREIRRLKKAKRKQQARERDPNNRFPSARPSAAAESSIASN